MVPSAGSSHFGCGSGAAVSVTSETVMQGLNGIAGMLGPLVPAIHRQPAKAAQLPQAFAAVGGIAGGIAGGVVQQGGLSGSETWDPLCTGWNRHRRVRILWPESLSMITWQSPSSSTSVSLGRRRVPMHVNSPNREAHHKCGPCVPDVGPMGRGAKL